MDDALALAAGPIGVAESYLHALHDRPLQRVEVGRPGPGAAAPAGRIEDDRRGGGLGVGPERLRERLHELAQRGLGVGRGGRRRAGDEEEGAGLGGGEPAEVGAGAAQERPSAALAPLRVDRDAGDGERLEVATRRLHGDLQLVGELCCGDPAP